MAKANESKAKAGGEQKADDKTERFICHDCGNTFDFNGRKTDPTSSKGCCKNCGSANWQIVDKATGDVLE